MILMMILLLLPIVSSHQQHKQQQQQLLSTNNYTTGSRSIVVQAFVLLQLVISITITVLTSTTTYTVVEALFVKGNDPFIIRNKHMLPRSTGKRLFARGLPFVSLSVSSDMTDNNKSSLSTISSSTSTISSSILPVPTKPILNCAVIGVGVLGTQLCQQIVNHNYQYYMQQSNNDTTTTTTMIDLQQQLIVTGITKTTNNHETIYNTVLQSNSNTNNDDDDDDNNIIQKKQFFQLITNDSNNDNNNINNNNHQKKYDNIVFCAPPSGFDTDDYANAIQNVIDTYWSGSDNGGKFIYTSSGAVYGDTITSIPPTDINSNSNTPYIPIVTEQTPVIDINSPYCTPRLKRLIQAENNVLNSGGYCIRLAGLYNLHRGPHNYWLTSIKHNMTIQSSPDGIVNMLHYEDAANACYCALLLDNNDTNNDTKESRIFLISDGQPITRYNICVYAKQAKYYSNCTIPQFDSTTTTTAITNNDSNDNISKLGKIYNGTYSNIKLQFQPKYISFQQYMKDNA